MSHTISIAVDLPATPAQLYKTYVSPENCTGAITGFPVKIAARAGARFEAFGGAIRGTILQCVPKRLIVQSWRSTHFGKLYDVDSTGCAYCYFFLHASQGRT